MLAKMSFRPAIAGDLREMDTAIFSHARLGLAQRFTGPLEARIDTAPSTRSSSSPSTT